MFFLTALAAAAAPVQITDCRPAMILMAFEKDRPEAARSQPQGRNEARKRPLRRCITLASA